MKNKAKSLINRLAAAAILLLVAVALPSAAKKDILTFAEKSFDFGTVTESSAPVVHEFVFTNTSDEPVAVLSVSTGCGCTRPVYPVEPVAPGHTGVIKITFTPKGQVGSVNKDIKVRYRGAKARSSQRVTLRLRGKVTPDR